MSKRLGQTIPLKVLVMNEDGTPITTATVKVQVRRDSDGYFWDGGVWVAGKTDLTVAHVANGLYVYSLDTSDVDFGSPPTISAFFWSSDTDLSASIGINFTLDEDYQARVVADDILVDTNEMQGKLPTNNIMGSSVKTDKDDEIDAILLDTNEIQGKLPTDNIMGSAVLTSKDDEIDAILVDTGTTLPAQITTHDGDMKALIGTPSVDISADIAANLAAITSIQNNTRFTSAIPEQMQKPDSGNTAFRWTGNLYDTDGNMEDPVNNEILVRVLQADGTPITANLYKEQALTNGLDNATDQANFPSGSGWRAMERLGVGQYDLFYKVADDETEEALTVEFGWDEASVIMSQYRATAVVDYAGDIEDIQTKVNAIHAKVDAPTPSPTIPAQITTHDTDIKALGRIEACPDWMYVPSGRSRINIVGGITAIATEIPVLDATVFETDGVVKIGTEYIIYTGITDSKLQVDTRGAYGSTPAAHNNNVVVDVTVLFPVRLVVYDNAGNMQDADSLPTVEIQDWNGTQELAPTNMTKLATGVYNYNYLITRGDIAENKVFIFSAVVNTITQIKHIEVIINNEPASELSLAQYLAGGTGEFVCDQDGWYDNDGIKTAWGDVLEGVVEDADTGAPLDDAYVTAYLVVNGEVLYNGRPPGQARTRVNGTWLMFLDAATYQFVFQKDGFRIAADGTIQRTVS